MDEIAAPPATQMRPFPPIRCIGRRRAGGSECEHISFTDVSESNGHRGGLREALGKHFLSEVIDPGRQEGRRRSVTQEMTPSQSLRITCRRWRR